jgi:SagB-type dehydrogenase family enzyme
MLHFSTKDLPYRRADETKSLLKKRAKQEPMPTTSKRYADAEPVRLPEPDLHGDFARVLLQRRTWRRFARSPMSIESLSTLLGLCCAVRHWVPVEGVGRFALKSYPSGGAQHPLEVYLVARNVRGLSPGIYHYASDAHCLERLRKGSSKRQIASYLPMQGWYGSASVLFLITAVFGRTQWKYRFSRAYKVVIAEAGHLVQNICLTATALRLAPFCTMALADTMIERDLGIDGVSESVVYAAGVGTRPPRTDWAPWPTAFKSRRMPGPLAHLE